MVNWKNVSFVSHLTELTSQIIRDTTKISSEPSFRIIINRDYNKHEIYTKDVLLKVSEVMTICDQLSQIPILLSNFRTSPKTKKAKITRFHYLVYHLENYYIRSHSLFDRILRLVNTIYRLGNSDKNCKEYIILNNVYLQNTEAKKLIDALNKKLSGAKFERHKIVHSERYKSAELAHLEAFYIVTENEPNFIPNNLLPNMTNKFVSIKVAELTKLNNELFSSVLNIFCELQKEFKTRHAELVV